MLVFGENQSYCIKCDCCGKETLAQIRGNKLVIMDRRHGQKHVAILSLNDLIRIMKEVGLFPLADEALAPD